MPLTITEMLIGGAARGRQADGKSWVRRPPRFTWPSRPDCEAGRR